MRLAGDGETYYLARSEKELDEDLKRVEAVLKELGDNFEQLVKKVDQLERVLSNHRRSSTYHPTLRGWF